MSGAQQTPALKGPGPKSLARVGLRLTKALPSETADSTNCKPPTAWIAPKRSSREARGEGLDRGHALDPRFAVHQQPHGGVEQARPSDECSGADDPAQAREHMVAWQEGQARALACVRGPALEPQVPVQARAHEKAGTRVLGEAQVHARVSVPLDARARVKEAIQPGIQPDALLEVSSPDLRAQETSPHCQGQAQAQAHGQALAHPPLQSVASSSDRASTPPGGSNLNLSLQDDRILPVLDLACGNDGHASKHSMGAPACRAATASWLQVRHPAMGVASPARGSPREVEHVAAGLPSSGSGDDWLDALEM